MKRRELVTRPGRVVLAAAAGAFVVWLGLLPVLYLQEAMYSVLGVWGPPAVATAATIVVMLFPVAPLWLLAHLRRATRRGAVLLAGLVGFAMILGPALRRLSEATGEALWIGAAHAAWAGAASAATAWVIWAIAYPRALQPGSPAEVF